ncbi:MAG: histidine triad nucleotide-binding protein [Acidimicrobiales bacterium]|nr:histidine triad nucleotide-binding protein [Acidimicrobiales bacterium]
MADCLFCQIVAGEVPSKEVVSGEKTYAFFDINPGAPVHFLVVPRHHITDAAQVDPGHAEIVAEMFVTARAGAEATGIADGGYRLVFNVGPHALNSVPHLHMHVLGGQQMGWPPGIEPGQ